MGTTFQLTLEYDGTAFSGWQRQPQARTVEGVLRQALASVGASPVAMTASGRTDAGAHAHGQVVGVALDMDWDADRLAAAVNAALPDDVIVRHAAPAPPSFHARFDALTRTYRYVVVPRPTRAAVGRHYAWQVRGPLDVDAMRRAAAMLIGTHDFAGFGRSPRSGGSTVRTVLRVDVRQVAITPAGLAVVIEVDADAFLYGMMRSFAGALVALGEGRMTEAELHALVTQPPSQRARLTVAPAHGLHQWAVTYPDQTPETR